MNVTIVVKLPEDTTMDNYQERADTLLEAVKSHPLTQKAQFVSRGMGNKFE